MRLVGRATRGTTSPNRLRRVDNWVACLLGPGLSDAPLVVDLGFGAVPAFGAEALLGGRVAGDRARARVVLHRTTELLEVLLLRVEAPARQHVAHRALLDPPGVDPWVLGEEAQRPGHHRASICRSPRAGERAEQRRLARAVPPHEPDLVARLDVEAGAAHEIAVGHGDGEVEGPDHPVTVTTCTCGT